MVAGGDLMYYECFDPSWQIKESLYSITPNRGSGRKTLHSRLISRRVALLLPQGCPAQYTARLHMALQLNRMDLLFIHCVTYHTNEVKQLKWHKARNQNSALQEVIYNAVVASTHRSHSPINTEKENEMRHRMVGFPRGHGHKVALLSLPSDL